MAKQHGQAHLGIGRLRDGHEDHALAAKLGYIFCPPGWSHDGSSLTAGALQKKLGLR